MSTETCGGVHIADVAHYVTEGSELDKEAFERGTSVCFPGRAIPMLPERLSNGICSLNPKIERLTFTCEMEIDKRGRFLDHKIYKSVIRTLGVSRPSMRVVLRVERIALETRKRSPKV